ncbi:hypothetical protein COR50_00720 [Chitinophaga caeni]|uniref:Uncharacterized protein n=1 Tax=Chitinophaga caeni TaxID=2029983 RepID=A0A291QP78_9BACT|nr:hypothetical protein COR50_00720 [Chitinophaga caeni]
MPICPFLVPYCLPKKGHKLAMTARPMEHFYYGITRLHFAIHSTKRSYFLRGSYPAFKTYHP